MTVDFGLQLFPSGGTRRLPRGKKPQRPASTTEGLKARSVHSLREPNPLLGQALPTLSVGYGHLPAPTPSAAQAELAA